MLKQAWNKLVFNLFLENMLKELEQLQSEFVTHIESIKITDSELLEALSKNSDDVIYETIVLKPLGSYPTRYLDIMYKNRFKTLLMSRDAYLLYMTMVRKVLSRIDTCSSQFIVTTSERAKQLQMTKIAESKEFQSKFLVTKNFLGETQNAN